MRYVYNNDEEKTFDYLKKLDASIGRDTKSDAAGGKDAVAFSLDDVKTAKTQATLITRRIPQSL